MTYGRDLHVDLYTVCNWAGTTSCLSAVLVMTSCVTVIHYWTWRRPPPRVRLPTGPRYGTTVRGAETRSRVGVRLLWGRLGCVTPRPSTWRRVDTLPGFTCVLSLFPYSETPPTSSFLPAALHSACP